MWQVLALLAMFMVAANSLMIKRLGQLEIPSSFSIFAFKAVAALLFIAATLIEGRAVTASPREIILLFLIAVLSNVGDIGQFYSLRHAPNPGYALAIIFLYPILVALISYIFQSIGGELNAIKLLGMSLCGIGAFLLATEGRQKIS